MSRRRDFIQNLTHLVRKWFLLNSFWEISWKRATKRYKKFKFWHFWERPLYDIWEIFVPLHEREIIHYLFYITCTEIQILKQIWKEKTLKNHFSSSKTFFKPRVQLYAGSIMRTVAFAPRRVSHVVFLINLILEQTSEDCIENAKYSNINVNDECNSK